MNISDPNLKYVAVAEALSIKAELSKADQERLAVFLEDLRNDRLDIEPPAADADPALVKDWAERFKEGETTAGEPVTLTVIAICATIAYCQKTNPKFLAEVIDSVGKATKDVGQAVRSILDSKQGGALLATIKSWVGA